MWENKQFIGRTAVGILCLCMACGTPSREPHTHAVGPLLFSVGEIRRDTVYWGEEVWDTLSIYNPTGSEVRWKPASYYPGLFYRRMNSESWPPTGVAIPPKTYDTLLIAFNMTDERNYGAFETFLNFEIDGRINYQEGIFLSGNVREYFDNRIYRKGVPLPVLYIPEQEVDFGEVKEGAELTFHFELENTGDGNLLLRKVETSCGCATVLPGKRVIQPGESVTLKIVFKTAGRNGRQHKTVTLICNDPENPEVKLNIKGNVLDK